MGGLMKTRVGKVGFFAYRKLLTASIAASGDTQDFDKHSGRTLSTTFLLISECLSKYNQWHVVQDHNPNANRTLLAVAFNVIEELNLEGFYYDKKENKLMFDLKMQITKDNNEGYLSVRG